MARTAYALKVMGCIAASLIPFAASAQQWPQKPVRIIIPWAPGGSTDIVGRLLAGDMTNRLKQQFIIDNRPGAGSILGLHLAAAAPPDGHNFMMTSTAYGHLINSKQAKGIDYAKSFDPVALIGFGDSVLVVHPTLPVNSVSELIALAKKRPGELNYSSSGIGGFPHMNTELFKLMTGTNIVHVPFQGGGPAAVDTMAGNTQINLGSVPSLIAHIRSGRLKPLGVGGKKRNAQLPKVPTMTESGVPGYVTYIWWAIFAPPKTSPDAVKAMHGAVMASLENRDMLQKLEVQGVEIQKASPADLGKLMVDETNKWQDVIRRAGIKGE
jgi:tripartite-type tricarboxylate transporter receptor subunit TctC